MKQHIYQMLASQRKRLGLSQHELAMRAGLRREKISRVESKGEDIGLDDLSRLLDAVGLQLAVCEKSAAPESADLSRQIRPLQPQDLKGAAFFDGSKARILSWGNIPK